MPVLFPYEAGHHLPAAGHLHFTYIQVSPSPVIEFEFLGVPEQRLGVDVCLVPRGGCVGGVARHVREQGGRGPSHHLPDTCRPASVACSPVHSLVYLWLFLYFVINS